MRTTPLSSYGSIRVERLLPFPGEVLVKEGERVEPEDVVAVAFWPTQAHLLQVARALSVSEGDLPKYLRKGVGETVEGREVIAATKGVLIRHCRAPASGRIAAQAHGRLLLEASSPWELRALLRGFAIEVIPYRGVVMEASGATLEGIWSNGKEAYGVLKRVVGEFVPQALDLGYHGAILVGESWATEEGLKKASEIEARGVVVGGLDSSLREMALSLPFPVVITEGFGKAPMAEPLFSFLQGHEGREVSILRSKFPQRGQVVIPFYRSAGEPEGKAPALEEGALVRLIKEPHLGKVGRLATPPQKRKMEWGGEFLGAEVDMEGERAFIPLTNLEPLETLESLEGGRSDV